jgi:hypothetical protein
MTKKKAERHPDKKRRRLSKDRNMAPYNLSEQKATRNIRSCDFEDEAFYRPLLRIPPHRRHDAALLLGHLRARGGKLYMSDEAARRRLSDRLGIMPYRLDLVVDLAVRAGALRVRVIGSMEVLDGRH